MRKQTIKMTRAQDLTFEFRMAPPRDITSWTIAFVVKEALGGSTAISKSTSSGITITNAGKGIIQITIAKANTSGLTLSTDLDDGEGYVWEVRRTDSGSELVLAKGNFILEEEVVT